MRKKVRYLRGGWRKGFEPLGLLSIGVNLKGGIHFGNLIIVKSKAIAVTGRGCLCFL
jgi:hypothetical protein